MKKMEFTELGVTFYLPKSMEDLHIRNFGKPQSLPPDPNGVFVDINKAIIKFEFVDPNTNMKPTTISPFTMKVKFKKEHLPVGGVSDLKLGIHDGSKWHDLTSKSKKTLYKTTSNSKWHGNFKVEIDGEADPAMAVGP